MDGDSNIKPTDTFIIYRITICIMRCCHLEIPYKVLTAKVVTSHFTLLVVYSAPIHN